MGRSIQWMMVMMWLASFGQALPHGVTHHVVQGGAGVRAKYEEGHPVAFAEVRVFAPGQAEVYQEGFTDADGYFMISAATPGSWRMEIDDGMGHKLVALLEPGTEVVVHPAMAAPLQRPVKILFGLSVILAVSGFYAWWRQRRKPGAA